MDDSLKRSSFIPPAWIITLSFIVGMLWLVLRLRELVMLLVLGYFIAYAVDPIIERLEKRGLSRVISFWILLVVFASAMALLGITAVPTLIEEFEKLSVNLNQYLDVGRGSLLPFLEGLREHLPEPFRSSESIDDMIASIPGALSSVSGDTLKGFGRAVLSTITRGYNQVLTLINLLLLPFIVYYVAIDLPRIHGFFLGLFPILKRGTVKRICGEIDGYVSSFVRGQVLVCSILFVLYSLGLGFVGIDLWLLVAFITGFGNLIPYVGTISGILLSSLMALVTFGDFQHVLWVWLVFAVVQGLEGAIITPLIIGETVGLSPLVIMLALYSGGQLFGLLGLFLAIPIAAVVKVLARNGLQWALDR